MVLRQDWAARAAESFRVSKATAKNAKSCWFLSLKTIAHRLRFNSSGDDNQSAIAVRQVIDFVCAVDRWPMIVDWTYIFQIGDDVWRIADLDPSHASSPHLVAGVD